MNRSSPPPIPARRLLSGAAALSSLWALTACVATPSPFSSERTPDDDVPTDVSRRLELADPTSTRLAGIVDGNRVYLALPRATEHGVCLVLVDDSEDPVEGCGTAPQFDVLSPTITARFVVDGGGEVGRGWTRVSPNVSIRARD
ncbi:hypothetical protein LLS1_32500 [Leifsonia sp. LS1]|nr:hypothetical protein LLS1_32500 [Leifsonia sp. LS1]